MDKVRVEKPSNPEICTQPSWDSSVSEVPGYALNDRASILSRVTFFSLGHQFQPVSEIHLTVPSGYWAQKAAEERS
jgi:hypothetical protein